MFNFKYLLYCLFVVVSVSNKSCGNGDVFMSSSAMNKVFQMEQEMVRIRIVCSNKSGNLQVDKFILGICD